MPLPLAFDYSLFGLHVRSELALPELLAAPSDGQPEVTVRLGQLPAGGPGLQATDQGMLLTIDGVARYAIADGADITIDREPGVPDANVRLYLLGSAMGVLLHQRGLLPLHANAVEIDGKAFAFMGASGSGKSTLAAWFHDQGYRVIADDICVVRFNSTDAAFVSPGLPRIRLWRDVMDASGRDVAGYSRSYAGDESYDKYDVPVGIDSAVQRETELGAIYLLENGDKVRFAQLTGVKAADAVFANTYRGGYVSSTGGIRTHWETSLKLIRGLPIYLCTRPMAIHSIEQNASQVLEHAMHLARTSNPATY